ncbi:MAG: hypothetical protein WCR40_00950 [Candidatus Paceibacterota bacterium]
MLDVQTGEDFERLVLGISRVDLRLQGEQATRTNFFDSVEEVKKKQGLFNHWNPKRPKTKLSMNLFQNVRFVLGEKRSKNLRLFVSVGTRLDFRFGTDCFFEIDGFVASIDLTISEKKHFFKANVLVRPVDIVSRQVWIARRIASFLERNS